MLKLSKALCALLALCLLASTSLAEEEGLVAFQEEINGVRFHAMVDASIAEAPVIEGAFWDPASGHEALAQNLGAYFGVPAMLEDEDTQYYYSCGYALGEGRFLRVQGYSNQTLYVKDSPYTDWLFASNRGHFGEEDFQFASREEAARRVDELIRATGLGLQMQCSGAYSVNGAQYIARVEEETGNYAALGKDFAGQVLPGVEADDEIAYVLTFEQVVNGLPLSASYSLWYGAHWLPLCTEAVLSPAGVERLTLFSPYMPKSAGEPQALISHRDAALSLANSEDVRSSLELYGEGEFSRVRLCYMAEVRENDAAHVRLLPVWEFQGVFVRENDQYQITCLVSALSGEVIDSPNSEVLLRERE